MYEVYAELKEDESMKILPADKGNLGTLCLMPKL